MRKNKLPFVLAVPLFFTASIMAFSFSGVSCYAAQYLHTRDTAGITNLTESAFYGDTVTHIGTAYTPGAPKDQYNFCAFNLGNVPKVVAGWPVWQKTGYNPPSPYWQTKTQVCENNAVGTDKTALQASGKNWGGYMKSTEWTGSGDRMTLRYSYSPSTPPAVFSSGYSSSASLVVAANIAVTKYDGGGSSPTVGPVGWSVITMLFQDVSTGQMLTLITQVFDTRGFKTYDGTQTIGAGISRERVVRVPTGEMCGVTHFGPGTKYCTKLATSSNSQITVMSTNKAYFAYSVSRTQLANLITDVNNYLNTYEMGATNYSTDQNNYVLKEACVGVEATRIPIASEPVFSMSYIGDNFNVYTSY
ncbi:MAG: hypothetical protein HOO88_06060 [Kiritimatiellaceae bacterium]|nr:hypothetical protein [Kiritimatiellaceae bacterium]